MEIIAPAAANNWTFNQAELSPDGRKMVWTSNRSSEGAGFMQGLQLHVMDVTSLNLGPKKKSRR